MGRLIQDVRFAFRSFCKTPGLVSLAVITLALGIGAVSGIFSLVNAALLRPLPVTDPDRLCWVFTRNRSSTFPGGAYGSTSFPDYSYYRDHNEVFSGLAAYTRTPIHISDEREPERIEGALVSGNYFSVLGVRAILGRTLKVEDDRSPGAHSVAVISTSLWKRRFGSDPDVVGKPVTLNAHPFSIVGVASPDFIGTEVGFPYEMWVPLMMSDRISHSEGSLEQHRWGGLEIIGRLKPGSSLEQARVSMNPLAQQLAEAYPETNRDGEVIIEPVSKGSPRFRSTFLSITGLLMSAVGVVLLIACANLANLLLARGVERRREIAIRMVMGASRFRLIRQLLTESLLLSLVGGTGGLVIASWISSLFVIAKPQIPLPIEVDLSLDMRVLGFTFLVSLLTGVLFGLAPALHSSRRPMVPVLKSEKAGVGRPGRRLGLRNFLVVGQVALSLALLTTAGLFLRSLYRLQSVDPGFETAKLLIASVDLGLEGYSPSQGQDFYRRIGERVGTLPGVQDVSLAQYVPLTNLYMPASATAVTIEGREPPPDGWPLWVASNVVGPRYFETMGIPMVRGRGFGPQAGPAGPESVIINETMAREFWPGEDPIGKSILVTEEEKARSVEVIGVVRDSKYFTLWEEALPYLYLPLAQNYISWAALHVRTAANPAGLLAAVRHEVQAIDDNLPVFHVSTLSDALRLSLFPPRMGAALLGGFGLLALLLAAVGIYGVMAHAASHRTHEIGIRMALGARARDVLRLILSENLFLVMTGIGCGLAGAWAVKRLLSRFLYGVTATDPMTLVGVTLLLIAVAFLACYTPARRATKVDPSLSLRYE